MIDYTQEDFTRNGGQYDLILAVNGYHSLADYRRALKPGGQYLMAGGSNTQIFQALLLGPWYSMGGKQKMGPLTMVANPKDLAFIKELVEARKIKPVIDRFYPLSEAAEALRYVGEGHARGKVVISV